MNNNTPVIVSGYAAIVGRPNVGKSTLLNNFASMRLAIVSAKPQTTRYNIKYIHDDETSQIVFIDTPGMHTPRNRLGERMMEQAVKALQEADIVLLIVDATSPQITATEKNCCEVASKYKKQVILLLNKCDIVAKEKLLPIIAKFSDFYTFAEIIPISAIKKDGINSVLDEIKQRLPEGPRYYPEDTLTDQTEKEISTELIREQILRYTSEELPHGTAVEIEKFKEIYENENESVAVYEKLANESDKEENEELDARDSEDSSNVNDDRNNNTDGEFGIIKERHIDDDIHQEIGERTLVKISAIIYCEKDSHKKMLIGKNGEMIKRIGIGARKRIEELLQCKVHLELFVKVRKDWRNDTNVLSELGYTSKKD